MYPWPLIYSAASDLLSTCVMAVSAGSSNWEKKATMPPAYGTVTSVRNSRGMPEESPAGCGCTLRNCSSTEP